ncbi:MAG: hypothetical protein AAGF04_01615 [Chlamydiota bacterium]
MLKILKTNPLSVDGNMQVDRDLLSQVGLSAHPTLHFYSWMAPESITYGYFFKPEEYLDLEKIATNSNVQIGQRMTGGGAVDHAGDLAFSLTVPSRHPCFSSRPLENYQFVNGVVQHALVEFFSLRDIGSVSGQDPFGEVVPFCMGKATRYDLVVEGKKAVGAAQRTTELGYLHQGTISLLPPRESFLSLFLPSKEEMRRAIIASSHALFQGVCEEEIENLRGPLREVLAKHFREALDNPFRERFC